MATPTADQPRYLHPAEAARYLRIHRGTLYRWISEGRIRATKVGQRWYVAREDLDAILPGGAA